MVSGPFRWDIKKREQLGNLPEVERAETYGEFFEDLRTCAANVVGSKRRATAW